MGTCEARDRTLLKNFKNEYESAEMCRLFV